MQEEPALSVNLQGALTSILDLLDGDCSNHSDWGRRLLLVCGRVWGYYKPRKDPLLYDRRHGHERAYFAHCSRILLLPNLVVEQAVVVALRDCCYRTHLGICYTTHSCAQRGLNEAFFITSNRYGSTWD